MDAVTAPYCATAGVAEDMTIACIPRLAWRAPSAKAKCLFIVNTPSMKMIAQRAALLLGALCMPLAALAAEPQPTHEFSLDNGLKVIVREDHRAPVVVSQLWYKVGSSYETPGQTGLSHALEHMMFKGSRKLGPGEASRILRELGAEEFAREIEVIKEERRLRTDDKPSSLAYERFKATAYPASGYHTPTIGWMADLERMTVEELRAWYEAWYAPNNATLVVV